MLTFPNCKINLGLRVIRKRDDGYHDIETLFYPIDSKDILEVIEADGDQPIQFSTTGLKIPGDENNNLCIKAYKLLKKDHPQLPAIKMHLHKAIPIGAGLGGGSANGAFALKLLNEKFHLNLATSQLVDYAVQLGSDCPFFIINKSCFATGRGEIIKELPLDLSGYSFKLINPGIHIDTSWAFSELGRGKTVSQNNDGPAPFQSLADIVQLPIGKWDQYLFNDFEEPVFKKYPQIKAIKEELYLKGAVYASMSGSGSTVFGIFEKQNLPDYSNDERVVRV